MEKTLANRKSRALTRQVKKALPSSEDHTRETSALLQRRGRRALPALAAALLVLPLQGCAWMFSASDPGPISESTTNARRTPSLAPDRERDPSPTPQQEYVPPDPVPKPDTGHEYVPPEPAPVPEPEPETVPEPDPSAAPQDFVGLTFDDPGLTNFIYQNDCYWYESYIICPDIDVSFLMHGGRVNSAKLGNGFTGPTPGGISFGDTPEAVVEKLGEPTSATEISMHYQYSDNVLLLVDFPANSQGGYGPPQPFVVNAIQYQLSE
jgi:hypothetical protein